MTDLIFVGSILVYLLVAFLTYRWMWKSWDAWLVRLVRKTNRGRPWEEKLVQEALKGSESKTFSFTYSLIWPISAPVHFFMVTLDK